LSALIGLTLAHPRHCRAEIVEGMPDEPLGMETSEILPVLDMLDKRTDPASDVGYPDIQLTQVPEGLQLKFTSVDVEVVSYKSLHPDSQGLVWAGMTGATLYLTKERKFTFKGDDYIKDEGKTIEAMVGTLGSEVTFQYTVYVRAVKKEGEPLETYKYTGSFKMGDDPANPIPPRRKIEVAYDKLIPLQP
jgi:hypothetical protein